MTNTPSPIPDPALERLRELSERATPELTDGSVKAHVLADILRNGALGQDPPARNRHNIDWQADAAFIVACVNYVRAALPPRDNGDKS